jgi:hypothetical protein
MKRVTYVWCLIAISVVGQLGCSKQEDSPEVSVAAPVANGKKPAEVVQLEQAFQQADTPTKETVNVAASALATKDYEKAAVALMAAQSSPKLTFQQGLVLRKSMRELQYELLQRAERGDPRAIAAMQAMRGGGGGR